MSTANDASRPCPQCGTACPAEHHYCPTCGFPVANVGRTDSDHFVGQTLPGGYHVLDLVAVGGMGRVYRAEQAVLGRTVAVKVIHPHLLSDENSAARFLTEARAASQLNHPNSIAVFDFGRTDDGQPYLVMEFLRGKDLARVAYEEGPLPFARIIDVLRQVLAALGEAHELGIIHRDLKPENIVLEPQRRGGDFVKVLDFGLAKLRADSNPSVTSPGIVCGTPDYMAPEQGRGDPIDGRSDLYAVGVILFQMLTGRLPYEADSPTQVVMMHMTLPVPDPHKIAPERRIPDVLVDILMRAMSKDARQRYQDAGEFSDALRGALEQLQGPTAAGRAGVDERVTCVACQALVPPTKFCQECGGRLPERAAVAAITIPQLKLPLPMVGRSDDIAFLEERRRAAASRTVGARLIGDIGVGKTRLLGEFLTRCRQQGDHTVLTNPDPYWAEVPYYALRQAILGLMQLEPADLTRARMIGASDDAIASVEEMFESVPDRVDRRSPLRRRHGLADALRWALTQASQQARSGITVLAIDDMQRVDSASRGAFSDVLGEPPICGALLLCAHPAGFESGWGASHPSRRLGPLPPKLVSELIAQSGASSAAAPEQTSPLHVEQFIRFVHEDGGDPPAGLADLLLQRIDLLGAAARRALQALAVLGDESDPDAVGALLGSDEDVDLAIAVLQARGMIAVEGKLLSAAHPLIRELAAASTPAAVRRELHARSVTAPTRRPMPLEARALHSYQAEDAFQALLLLEQVAERALNRGDTSSEILSLRRGLEMARREIARGELDDPLRAMLIFGRKLGAALTRAGNFADAEGVLREALDVAGPRSVEKARVLGALAHVAHGRRRHGEALDYIERAIDAAEASSSRELVAAFRDTHRAWMIG
jgi:tRNA A-37 threonylcarbamoyl transferase component Bud32